VPHDVGHGRRRTAGAGSRGDLSGPDGRSGPLSMPAASSQARSALIGTQSPRMGRRQGAAALLVGFTAPNGDKDAVWTSAISQLTRAAQHPAR
jgi:hypothetical protein